MKNLCIILVMAMFAAEVYAQSLTYVSLDASDTAQAKQLWTKLSPRICFRPGVPACLTWYQFNISIAKKYNLRTGWGGHADFMYCNNFTQAFPAAGDTNGEPKPDSKANPSLKANCMVFAGPDGQKHADWR